tara:strand:+ start:29 stop:451 length:423 start_codon:yes stop_codon:yes gene_type:complete
MDEKEFFSLLRQSNSLDLEASGIELKKNKKLLDFSIAVTNYFHFSERREYIDLAKDFLADQITADDFSGAFISLYEGIDQEAAQMKKDESLELINFIKTSQSELGDLLLQIYGTCDFFGHVIYDEKELKDCAQILLLKLQ